MFAMQSDLSAQSGFKLVQKNKCVPACIASTAAQTADFAWEIL